MTPSPRCLALGLSFAIATAASAAEIPKPPESSRAQQLVLQMRTGSVRVAGGDTPAAEASKNRAAIKTVAEWLAYSIASPPFNGEPVPREDKTPTGVDRSMRALFEEAERFSYLPIATGNQGRVSQEQLEYGAEFGKAVAVAAKVVLDNSARPIERVNAVRLLSVAAKLPAPDLVDPLVDVVNNPKISDAEKLYAFQGLRNLLEQTDVLNPNDHIPDLRRDAVKLGKIAQALTNYIMQKRTPRDDKDKAVIEYVRRHAVEAMARFKDGVLRKPNKDLVFRPSWTLARIMEQDPTAFPPFTVQEQTEAATGFALMRIDADLNLDVAAYTFAKISVIFGRAANVDSQRATRDSTLPIMHWRVAAARFSHALATMREGAKPLPKTRYPDTLINLANTANNLLARIEKGGAAEPTGNESQAVITWMTDNPPKAWTENPPKAATLYKDDPESILPFPTAPVLKTPDPKGTDPKKGPDPKSADPKKGPAKKP
ncbi:MAG TPA: hypothetical protein VKE40_10910 [Gemmataceae bacterium]|nr:hypothetical protein [Gemmataceae bacterium]